MLLITQKRPVKLVKYLTRNETWIVFSGVSRSNKESDVSVNSGSCLPSSETWELISVYSFSQLVSPFMSGSFFLPLQEKYLGFEFGHQSFRGSTQTHQDFPKINQCLLSWIRPFLIWVSSRCEFNFMPHKQEHNTMSNPCLITLHMVCFEKGSALM